VSDFRAVVVRPLITEKSMRGAESGKYVFEVRRDATKPQIRDAVERLFRVKVADVNVVNLPGRMRRRGKNTYRTAERRKAVVTLRAGETIDLEKLM
jgi:large subunit ribosomal protein L23